MKDFAGSLRERVEILKRTAARDALGAPGEDWTLADQVWASAVPIGRGAEDSARWRLTMRPCAVAVGDRIDRAGHMLEVRDVTADPAFPDRIAVVGDVVRS